MKRQIKRVVDVSKDLGNLMKYESSVIDIALKTLQKKFITKERWKCQPSG